MKSINIANSLVSVVMPTYNHGIFVGKAIESVLNQTYKNFELIIIDNYSEDDTKKIVLGYEDVRIKYLKFRNKGIIAASRNHGIEHSHGEYVAFLDSDDIWLPEKLDMQVCHFEDKEVVAVSSKVLLNRGGMISRRFISIKNKYTDYGFRDFLFRNWAACSSTIVRKDILLNLKGFDERKEFLYIEDWELWLRVAQKGKFRVLEEPLVFYLVSDVKKWKEIELTKRHFYVLEKHVREISNSDINEAKAKITFLIAFKLILMFDPKSREYFAKALKYPSNMRTKLKISIGYFCSILPMGFLKVAPILFYRLRPLTYTSKKTDYEI